MKMNKKILIIFLMSGLGSSHLLANTTDLFHQMQLSYVKKKLRDAKNYIQNEIVPKVNHYLNRENIFFSDFDKIKQLASSKNIPEKLLVIRHEDGSSHLIYRNKGESWFTYKKLKPISKEKNISKITKSMVNAKPPHNYASVIKNNPKPIIPKPASMYKYSYAADEVIITEKRMKIHSENDLYVVVTHGKNKVDGALWDYVGAETARGISKSYPDATVLLSVGRMPGDKTHFLHPLPKNVVVKVHHSNLNVVENMYEQSILNKKYLRGMIFAAHSGDNVAHDRGVVSRSSLWEFSAFIFGKYKRSEYSDDVDSEIIHSPDYYDSFEMLQTIREQASEHGFVLLQGCDSSNRTLLFSEYFGFEEKYSFGTCGEASFFHWDGDSWEVLPKGYRLTPNERVQLFPSKGNKIFINEAGDTSVGLDEEGYFDFSDY